MTETPRNLKEVIKLLRQNTATTSGAWDWDLTSVAERSIRQSAQLARCAPIKPGRRLLRVDCEDLIRLLDIVEAAEPITGIAIHLRLAATMAKIMVGGKGTVQLGVIATKEDGSGFISARFEVAQFIADMTKLADLFKDAEDEGVDDNETIAASTGEIVP